MGVYFSSHSLEKVKEIYEKVRGVSITINRRSTAVSRGLGADAVHMLRGSVADPSVDC